MSEWKLWPSCFVVTCPAGQQDEEDMCEQCPLATFKTDAGPAKCTDCPAGFTTAAIGTINAVDCDIGKWDWSSFVSAFLFKKKWEVGSPFGFIPGDLGPIPDSSHFVLSPSSDSDHNIKERDSLIKYQLYEVNRRPS